MILSVVAATFISIILVASVMVPISLALTHTGPFAIDDSTTTTTTSTTSTSATTTTTTTSTTTTTTTSTSTTTTTSATTTTTTSATTTTTTTTTTTAGPAECSSYTTINDATRLTTAAGATGCDGTLFTSSTTWVRFSGAGGTQLATSAPSTDRCGTQATGWYSSSLPTSGNTVTGTVCYNWSGNTCNWSNSIQVTNCGSFYVWGLVAPGGCSYRYCTV